MPVTSGIFPHCSTGGESRMRLLDPAVILLWVSEEVPELSIESGIYIPVLVYTVTNSVQELGFFLCIFINLYFLIFVFRDSVSYNAG